MSAVIIYHKNVSTNWIISVFQPFEENVQEHLLTLVVFYFFYSDLIHSSYLFTFSVICWLVFSQNTHVLPHALFPLFQDVLDVALPKFLSVFILELTFFLFWWQSHWFKAVYLWRVKTFFELDVNNWSYILRLLHLLIFPLLFH